MLSVLKLGANKMDKKSFEVEINKGQLLSGKMDMMANSIDLVISCILEKLGYKLNKKTLGHKIGLFKKSEPKLSSRFSGKFDLLIKELELFNANWNAIKHGMMVGGTSQTTFQKDGIIFVFDSIKIAQIDSRFTETMSNLSEIWNNMLKEDQSH